MQNTNNKFNKFLFKVIWSKTYVAISINKIYNESYDMPLTTFYFWPNEDGWTLLKAELDSKPWISEISKKSILNGYTLIINYWLQNVNKNLLTKKLIVELKADIIALNSIDCNNFFY
jgi:Plastid and cyanobacterial ribosomal protein (PSRP-3 / Ycf65)